MTIMPRLVSRRAFVPLAALAVAGLGFALPAIAAPPKPPQVEIWVVTASHAEKPDAGRVVPADLAKWGELDSDPLKSYTKFEVVDHVTAPLTKDKALHYTIKGEPSTYDITLLGIEEPPKTKALEYVYRIVFPSPENKPESLHRVTKQGERTIIRDRGYKGGKSSVRFIAIAVGP